MKVVLITGGSKGIGKASAIELAKRGFKVVITYSTSPEGAEDTLSKIREIGGQALALKFDVSRIDMLAAFSADLRAKMKLSWNTERIDCLFNNAGVGGYNLIENVTETEFDAMMGVHLKGPFFLIQNLLPLINEGGHILNMSSATVRVAFAGCAPYASMKSGLEALTRYLAKELGARGIRANSIAPGAIRTDLGGGIDNAPEFVKLLTDMTALGRIGEPSDVAKVVASLFSDDSNWINGQCIEISGGMSL